MKLNNKRMYIHKPYLITGIQVIPAIISIPTWFFFGKNFFLAVICGIFLALIPHVYFSRKVFYFCGAKSASQIVKNLYVGEFVKFSLTVAGFCVAFLFFSNEYDLALIMAFIAEQLIIRFSYFWSGRLGLKANKLIKNSNQMDVKNYGK